MKKALLFLVGVMVLLPVLAFAATYSNPLIQTDKDYYSYGEEIRVYYYNAPGYARDWICVAPEGSPDTYAGDYQYIPQGHNQGVMVFKPQQPGNYEVRAYYGYNPFQYFVTARYPFSVEGDEYGYSDDGYYDVPVVYGEPCYYPPPVTVTFAFDYFTYEVYGSYIDIVFWRDGHRYRHNHWYDQGRRVTPNHIHSGQWHNRVRGSDLTHHRDYLRDKNKISHPDTYYGIKPRPEGKPDLRRQGQDYKRPNLQSDKGLPPQVTRPQPDIKRIPQKDQKGQPRQWERKTGQQTPQGRVWGQQPSGTQEIKKPSQQPFGSQEVKKPSRETTRKPAWEQPSQPSEQKSGSGREKSVDKERKSRESSEPSERKSDSNRDESRDSDNRSQSSGGSSSQSDNRGWSGGSGGSSGGSSGGGFGGSSGGHSQGSTGGKNDDRRGRW